MFERFKKNGDDRHGDRGAVATADRPAATRETTVDEGRFGRDRTTTGVGGREAARDVRARKREEYGGLNWGAAFFGWLVAIGMAAILTAIVSAAGAAIGLSEGESAAR